MNYEVYFFLIKAFPTDISRASVLIETQPIDKPLSQIIEPQ